MAKLEVQIPDEEYETFEQISSELLRTPENHVAFWIRSVVRDRRAQEEEYRHAYDEEGITSDRV